MIERSQNNSTVSDGVRSCHDSMGIVAMVTGITSVTKITYRRRNKVQDDGYQKAKASSWVLPD